MRLGHGGRLVGTALAGLPGHARERSIGPAAAGSLAALQPRSGRKRQWGAQRPDALPVAMKDQVRQESVSAKDRGNRRHAGRGRQIRDPKSARG